MVTVTGAVYNVDLPGTGVDPSRVYQMLVLPLDAIVKVAPLRDTEGATVVCAVHVAPVVFPIWVGAALVGGVVSW